LHYNQAKSLDLSCKLHYIARVSTENKQTELLQLRIRPSEKEAFSDAASIAGISVSAWVRERLRLVAIRELEDAGRKIAFLKD